MFKDLNKKLIKKLIAGALALSVSLSGVTPIVNGLTAFAEGGTTEISQIQGLEVWYDATTLNLSDGEKVSVWKNSAPNPSVDGVGDAVQANDSRQPTYQKNGSINGLPTVKLNSSSLLRAGGAEGFYMPDKTIFAVVKAETAEGHYGLFSRLSGHPYDHSWFFNLEGGFNFGWGYSSNGSSSSYYQAKVHLEDDTPYILTGITDEKVGYSYVNGWLEQSFSGPIAKDNNAPVYIGEDGQTLNGEIGEIIVFSKALSQDEFYLVENYLEQKWGLEQDRSAMLKSLSVKGEPIPAFKPTKVKYSYFGEEVKTEDISAVPFDLEDTINIARNGTTFTITVTSKTTGNTRNYILGTSTMNYDYKEITQLGLNEVKINEGFWGTLLEQYSGYTINYIFDMFDYSESFTNFDRVAKGERFWLKNTSSHAGEILIPSGANRLIGSKDGSWNWGREPWREGLILETIRGACSFIIENSKDPDYQQTADALVERISGYVDRIYAAGLTTTGKDSNGNVIDGYFSTFNLLTQNSIFDEATGGAVYNHDLYNIGCLIEAGIYWYRTTGDTRLLYLATRFVEFTVDYVYGYGDKKGIMTVPPHAIAEETLLMLYDLYKNNPSLVKEMQEEYSYPEGLSPDDRYAKLVIRTDKYLELCNNWITERGVYDDRYNNTSYGVYAQDQCTHDQMTEALGHAVRANLWYSSIAAIGNYTSNASYVKSAKTLWDNIVDTQMYITGGTGASESLGEAYAGSYVLPQDGYCETCASVGMAFFAQNMSNIFGEASYADVVELQLYNGVLGSLSLDGNAFYYCNPLVSNEYQRPYWSGATPCCPPMYVKLFGDLPTLIYSKTQDKVFVNQYISSTAQFKLNGSDVTIVQYTDLPNGDTAQFAVKANKAFTLKLRMPSWATGADVTVGGKALNCSVGKDGYLDITENFAGETSVTVKFTKEVKRLYQPDVEYNAEQVAIQYGPFIYCAEQIDNYFTGGNLVSDTAFVLSPTEEFAVEYTEEFFSVKVDGKTNTPWGVNVIGANVTAITSSGDKVATLKLVPFYVRCNRDYGAMRVWLYEKFEVISLDGELTQYDLNKSDSLFDVYGELSGGYYSANGSLTFDSRCEYKAILKGFEQTENYEATLALGGISIDTLVNAGLYINCSNPSSELDKINAYNVQIEKAVGSTTCYISIFKFSSTGGYLGKVTSSQIKLDGTSVKIRCLVKDKTLYVFNGKSVYPLLSVKLPSEYSTGGVGIRSMHANTQIVEFSITK